jgi:hypothetical protein
VSGVLWLITPLDPRNMPTSPAGRRHRITWLIAGWLSSLAWCCTSHACQQTSSGPLDRGVSFLLSRQSADGLWHSDTYGNLKGGAAMTAFVLDSLPADGLQHKQRLQRAVDGLAPMIHQQGYVTNADGPDYSNYGSALLLSACRRHKLALSDDLQRRLVEYLVRSQLDEQEGYSPENTDYGGWDLSGWMTGPRPTTGTNISVSASVIEALSETTGGPRGESPDMAEADRLRNQTLARAALWLTRLQNNPGDGGFFFHPRRDHDGNKAGWRDQPARRQPRSYGSATCDGLRILLALGKTRQDPPVQAALGWLRQHRDLQTVPGFADESGTDSWGLGLRYYYYQSLSRCLRLLPADEASRRARTLTEILASEQREDGSWSNPVARMREDDPLIATGFAIVALRNCQEYLTDDGR